MLLFNQAIIDYEPYSIMPCPVRLFVEGAIAALKTASPHCEHIILSDLAQQIGCDIEALSFMIRPMETNAAEDIAVPDFQTVLMRPNV